MADIPNEEIIKRLMGIEELTATIQVTRLVELVMEELGLDPENEADLRKGQRVVTIVLVAIKNDLQEWPTPGCATCHLPLLTIRTLGHCGLPYDAPESVHCLYRDRE